MRTSRSRLPRTLAVALAVTVPLVICLLLSALGDRVQGRNAALVLVLVVVAAAATGSRAAGLTAAAVSAAGFDYFLVPPYHQFRIADRNDIETAVLLLLIGVAVSELALWGRRQQALASEQRGYLDGILQTTESVAGAVPTPQLIAHVEAQLTELLDLDSAGFVHSLPADAPVLQPDGSLLRNGQVVEVDRAGLPTDIEIMLPVAADGQPAGAFRLVAASHRAHPSADRRRVAAALAEQVGRSLRQSGLPR